MPSPIVLVHARCIVSLLRVSRRHQNSYVLSERGIDTTLRGYSVRTGREELGDTSSVETSLSQTEGRSQTCSSSANNDGIVLVIDNGVLAGDETRGLLGPQVFSAVDAGSGPCRRESPRWCAYALRELWRNSLAIAPHLRAKRTLCIHALLMKPLRRSASLSTLCCWRWHTPRDGGSRVRGSLIAMGGAWSFRRDSPGWRIACDASWRSS